MEIVIKIDEEDFEIMKHNVAVNNPLCPLSEKEMVTKIANGTPLPKGHGRLVDANVLQNDISHDKREAFTKHDVWLFPSIYNKRVPTIIEADKEVDE